MRLPRSTSTHFVTTELRRAIEETMRRVERQRRVDMDYAVAYARLRDHIKQLIRGEAT